MPFPMVWIETVREEEARGSVKEVYGAIKAAFGRPSPAFVAMSLHPAYLRAMWGLQRVVMAPGRLKLLEKEVLALAVSAANRCNYCVWAHSNRVRRLGMEGALVDQLSQNPEEAPLPPRLKTLVRWAVRATRTLADASPQDLEGLREAGLDDVAILEAAAVVGHFNHLNWVLDALGVEPPSD